MRSNWLLLIVVSLISTIRAEELTSNKLEEQKIKYAGPIVYSNEKPPIIYFPTPETTSSTQTKSIERNDTLNGNSIEYVPFPYQELPVLIYKSKDNPPIHVVPESKETKVSDNSNNSLSLIDKRLGETSQPLNSNQRGGRGIKWSNFKLFNDIPLVMKSTKWSNTDSNGVNVMSSHMIDMNNNSMLSSVNSPLSLANAPHVVYSGHPPIHVFPQPIIIKEPEMPEMTAASEAFQTFKYPNSGNNIEHSMISSSNKHEVSATPTNPGSSQFYSYGAAPPGANSGKSYGFRVKTRGNKLDTDYSSSQNYENYDDSYSPQHSDGSSDMQSEEKSRYRPNTQYSNSIADSNSEQYDKDYDRPIEAFPRDKSREKYPKYNSNNWVDWDGDNGWLSSLMAYNRYPSRPRRPVALSLVNAPTNEHLVFAGSPTNHMDFENMALMNPHLRHNAWVSGMNGMRPTASAIRPVYSLSSLFGYRRPPIPPLPPHPTPYYVRYNPGLSPASTNMAPMAMKPLGFVPPMMGLPSASIPMRSPYSPYMMYGYRRPPMATATGDLAFAESNRNTSNNANHKKWIHLKEDIQMSGSHVKPTFVMPSAKPTSVSVQNKPPIIIYQGLRPPVHVYKQPNLTIRHNSEIPHNSMMSAFQELQEMKNQKQDLSADTTTTTTTTTQSPYYQFYSTEDTNDSYDKNYKSGSALYFGENSAFSPRLTNEDWIPVQQTNNNLKDSQQKD